MGKSSYMYFLSCLGTLNFELVPENEVQELIWEGLEADNTIYKVETDEALLQLQVILLDAMKRYWVPRFLLHFRRTTSKETMEILTRPVPGDLDYLNHERRLRCRFMFPTIYQVYFDLFLYICCNDISSLGSKMKHTLIFHIHTSVLAANRER